MLTPRNLGKMKLDQCYYIPVVDEKGGMLNDPVAVKHSDDHWWISLADSDLLLWLKGLAVGRGLNVDIYEPDIHPLAVQGPKSDALMSKVFGDEITQLGFFRHQKYTFGDASYTIARSGWSVQGGFEIYVNGGPGASVLWDALFEAGSDLDVRAGCPNLIERIEGGLLSYGNDMTSENTPFEAGLGRFCKGKSAELCVGAKALQKERINGPKRQIRGVSISGEPIPACQGIWPVKAVNGPQAGHVIGGVSSAAWSPDLNTNIAIAMIDKAYWDTDTKVEVQAPDKPREAVVTKLPFV